MNKTWLLLQSLVAGVLWLLFLYTGFFAEETNEFHSTLFFIAMCYFGLRYEIIKGELER